MGPSLDTAVAFATIIACALAFALCLGLARALALVGLGCPVALTLTRLSANHPTIVLTMACLLAKGALVHLVRVDSTPVAVDGSGARASVPTTAKGLPMAIADPSHTVMDRKVKGIVSRVCCDAEALLILGLVV